MMNVDSVVIVWTVVSLITVMVSGAMVYTRVRSLQTIHRYPGNGDKPFRIFLAQQDIRRSTLRCAASIVGLSVGALIWAVQTGHLLDYAHWVPRWPWGLVTMALLILANEVLDRWALHELRVRYRRMAGGQRL